MHPSGSKLVERAQVEKTPLIAGDQATFVWAGARAPTLAGDMTGWRPWETTSGGQKMAEVESGIWTCTLTLPPDAYVEYVYFLDGQRVYDLFNPHRVPNGFGETNNCFWMPQAPRSRLFRRQRGVQAGTVSRTTFQSLRLAGGWRTARLYRPVLDGPYVLLLVLDGQDYFQRARLTTLADNLMHQGTLPPLAMVFLDNARPSAVCRIRL